MDTLFIMQSEGANVVPNQIAFARIFRKSGWHFICYSSGYQCVLNDMKTKRSRQKRCGLSCLAAMNYIIAAMADECDLRLQSRFLIAIVRSQGALWNSYDHGPSL